jgi:hypothetical protein
MQLQRSLDTFCGMYDFAVTGGAIGSYDLQVPIPKNNFLVEFAVIPLIFATSVTNSATISFDLLNLRTGVLFVGYPFAAKVISTFPGFPVFTEVGYFGVQPSDVIQAPTQFTDTRSIGISIGVEPLLSGKLLFMCRCCSFDLPQ